jgi:hypothetical protein
MRALAGDGKMRSFEMQAEKAGHIFRLGLYAAGDGPARVISNVSVIRVGSSAVVPNFACAAQICGWPRCLLVVQHHAAAAIHLQIDEAGYKQLTVGIDDRMLCRQADRSAAGCR